MKGEARGIDLIAAERERQVAEEGWTTEHDREHREFELAEAAICYIVESGGEPSGIARESGRSPQGWPWGAEWWKPGDRIRNLVKAGALIAAEIDRLQRSRKGK